MSLTPLSGGATTSAKVGDVNAVIAALNAELDAIRARQLDVEKTLGMGLNAAVTRIETLEQTPLSDHGHGELNERVEALENMIQRAPAENPSQFMAPDRPGRPSHVPAEEMTLIYDRATIYYHDMELYADRIGANRWRLYSQLNYMIISPAVWTYDEIVEGTAEEVYAHAVRRLEELAELKPVHDSVHDRVRRMSEGEV